VGTAVDYFIRAHLAATTAEHTVARNAARFLGATAIRAEELEREAAAIIADLHPWDRTLVASERARLSLACAALARFEQWFRAGPAVAAYIRDPLMRLRPSDGVAELVGMTVGEATLDDIAELGEAAVQDHADICRGRTLIANPKFAQSIPLGGADADVICDGLLLDWKATKTPRIVGRHELWQLVGYVLADTDDRYGLDRAGISALRWRRRVVWPLDALLGALSGEATRPLSEWRSEFAAVVASVAVARDEQIRRLHKTLR
jgi:hypothetical protein